MSTVITGTKPIDIPKKTKKGSLNHFFDYPATKASEQPSLENVEGGIFYFSPDTNKGFENYKNSLKKPNITGYAGNATRDERAETPSDPLLTNDKPSGEQKIESINARSSTPAPFDSQKKITEIIEFIRKNSKEIDNILDNFEDKNFLIRLWNINLIRKYYRKINKIDSLEFIFIDFFRENKITDERHLNLIDRFCHVILTKQKEPLLDLLLKNKSYFKGNILTSEDKIKELI